MLENGISERDALKVLSERARDNGRTPMQWNAEKNAGFSEGEAWIKIPENYININVEVEEKDEDSILNYYRKLVKLRKDFAVISDGDIKFIDTENEKVIAYKRTLGNEVLTVICNFSSNSEHIKNVTHNGKVLISNYDTDHDFEILRPYETVVIF